MTQLTKIKVAFCTCLLKQCVTAAGLSLLVFSTAMPAQAVTVYKTIENGVVKYSQLPPENAADVEVIELRDDGRRADPGTMAGRTNSDEPEPMSEEEQRIAQLEAQMAEQEAKQIAEQCQKYRNDLTNLNASGRIYELDENGEKKFLDNREIELKREQIQSALDQFCSS